MDFIDPTNENPRLSQDTPLNPHSNAESREEDFTMLIKSGIVSHNTPLEQLKHQDHSSTTPDDMTTEEPSSVVISRLKARHDLHLPPFKSLVITAPPPNLLLTPPDDTDPFFWKPLTRFATFTLSRTFPFPRTASLSPGEDPSSHTSSAENCASESDIENAAPEPSRHQSPPGFMNPQTKGDTQSPSNVQDCNRYGESAWLQESVEVVGKQSIWITLEMG